MALIVSIMSRIEPSPEEETEHSNQHQYQNYIGSLARATLPVSFFTIGGQVSASFFPVNHLSYHDVVGVHSAAQYCLTATSMPDIVLMETDPTEGSS